MKLQLCYPAKPFVVTQGWGVPNDAYLQFGFSKHNGIDFTIEPDGYAHAMCDGVVTETGNNPTGSGIYVKYKTTNVECEGVVCNVWFYYMHAEKILVSVGDKVKKGQPIIVADNTGFSTGPHTHITAFRYSLDERIRLDTDPATNFTFDWTKYLDGTYPDGEQQPSFKHTFLVDLEYGQMSPEVGILQRALQIIGYFPATQQITNYYGPVTRSAVFNFQKDYVAPKSWKAYLAVWANWGKYCASLTREELNKAFS